MTASPTFRPSSSEPLAMQGASIDDNALRPPPSDQGRNQESIRTIDQPPSVPGLRCYLDCESRSGARPYRHVDPGPRVSTTNKHYNQAQMMTAPREHHREILNLRKKARSWRSRRSRKT